MKSVKKQDSSDHLIKLQRSLLVIVLIYGLVLVLFSQNTGNFGFTKLNINYATEQEMQLLPGVGEKKAHRIYLYRRNKGPLKDFSDLMYIKGIGAKKARDISSQVRWETPY